MLSASEASVFPTPYEKQILRLWLRMTLRHSLKRRQEKTNVISTERRNLSQQVAENFFSNLIDRASARLFQNVINSLHVMLSESEASAFPVVYEKQILRLRLRMTF
jgi:hypothetical protein